MTDKKKLHHIFYNFDTGGAQKRLADFIAYSHSWFDHYITALNGDYSYLDNNSLNATKYHIPYDKGNIVKNIRTIRKAIKTLSPDCVLTQNFGTLEAIIANTPRIFPHIHNEDGFGKDEFDQLKWKRNLLRKIFLSFKTLIVPSQQLHMISQKNWCGLKTKIHYIANGVPDFEAYQQCPFNNYGKFTLGTVSVCRPEKNLGDFIKLIATLKHHQLNVFGVLVGDGSEMNTLRQLAQDLHLNETDFLFAGFQNNHRSFTAHFDIFALSSLTEQQPFGILDAMAAGLPVIATHVGDIPLMVSQDNHPYVDNLIFTQNYGKVVNLIQNQDLYKKIGQQNHRKFQSDYTLEKSLNRRSNVISELIQNGSS